MEASNALLRISDVIELSETETKFFGLVPWAMEETLVVSQHIPLACSASGVDDGLRGLNITKPLGISEQELIVSGGVKAANIHIAVSGDPILEALLKGLDLARGGEDRRNCLGNGWALLKQLINVLINCCWDLLSDDRMISIE